MVNTVKTCQLRRTLAGYTRGWASTLFKLSVGLPYKINNAAYAYWLSNVKQGGYFMLPKLSTGLVVGKFTSLGYTPASVRRSWHVFTVFDVLAPVS
jgi:hypothetical protein